MSTNRLLFIPVVLGTTRQGRASENVARFVFEELGQHAGVETELIDIRDIRLPTGDAGEAIKDSKFSAQVSRADGLVPIMRQD